VNTLVKLRIDGCCPADLSTRVEEVGGGATREGSKIELLVAAPFHPCGEALPKPGTTASMHWTTPLAVMYLPVIIAGTRRYPRPGWELAADAVVHRIQRRRHVRVQTSALPLELRMGDQTVQCRLVDLSEGGLRCVTMMPVPFAAGAEIVVWLDLATGLTLLLSAVVVRTRPGLEDRTEIACQFANVSKQTSDQLRRYVAEVQRRQRARQSGLAD
jgi:hypothetical protein